MPFPVPPPNPFPLGAAVYANDLQLLGKVTAVNDVDPKTYTVTFENVKYEQIRWIGGPSK